MTKKANPTLVGGFVLGAAALFVVGTVAFGRGKLFRDEVRFVCYFDTSVAGLDIGAPVRVNGVRVGEVVDIRAVWTMNQQDILTPVTLSLARKAVKPPPGKTAEEIALRDPYEVMERLVEDGLRAELMLDSVVTGKLYVALSSHPGSPIRLRGGTEYPEIPTQEAAFARLAKSLEDLPIGDMVDETRSLLNSLRDLADDPELRRTIASTNSLLTRVEQHVDPLADSVQETLTAIRDAATTAEETIDGADDQVLEVVQDLRDRIAPLSESADETLLVVRRTLDQLNGALGGESDVLVRVVTALEDLSEAARAVQGLARTLERHPEALISGKPQR